jgi:hypothetical protein
MAMWCCLCRGIIDTEQSIIDALAYVADEDLSRIVTSINVAQVHECFGVSELQ